MKLTLTKNALTSGKQRGCFLQGRPQVAETVRRPNATLQPTSGASRFGGLQLGSRAARGCALSR